MKPPLKEDIKDYKQLCNVTNKLNKTTHKINTEMQIYTNAS